MGTMSFEKIKRDGNLVNELELYKHYHTPEMLNRYDSNLIEFKRMPSLLEFQEAEQILHTYHTQYKQNHLKFTFPSNEQISDEVTEYLKSNSYSVSFLELYTIEPSQFCSKRNSAVTVRFVTEEDFEAALELNYKEDIKYGINFAKEKKEHLKRLFRLNDRHFVIAYDNKIPVGFSHLIEQPDIVEIDNFFVLESMQRKGIGGTIQQFVMDHFPEKTIILVAEGEDTAKDMYRKQNYEYLGFKYEALKVDE